MGMASTLANEIKIDSECQDHKPAHREKGIFETNLKEKKEKRKRKGNKEKKRQGP